MIIVHNPAAAAMVRDHCVTAKIIEIPHLFAPASLLPEEARCSESSDTYANRSACFRRCASFRN
jgi:hypothetical protein